MCLVFCCDFWCYCDTQQKEKHIQIKTSVMQRMALAWLYHTHTHTILDTQHTTHLSHNNIFFRSKYLKVKWCYNKALLMDASVRPIMMINTLLKGIGPCHNIHQSHESIGFQCFFFFFWRETEGGGGRDREGGWFVVKKNWVDQ